MMNEEIPPPLAQILESELAPGERVLWQARPSAARLVEFQVYVVFYSLTILLFIGVIFWISRSPAFRLVDVRPLEFIVLFAICVAALSPIVLWCSLRQIVYAVTDRRAILIHAALLQRRVQSFTGEQLVRIVRTEDRQGRGSILFERRRGFRGIANVRSVEDLLRQTYLATRPA